ncbi:tRNA lysidine(34) synthetase TilS [Novosphingobium sp.]|uniref:tRNA lysidine(34) synthetase TilS n=1 Tax=Novosphingobium sp. TaxID=1874826 RepID=UPI0025F7773B|nr:tRNA lysidine(34) synthetase TilS [Novosphingobium sp.]
MPPPELTARFSADLNALWGSDGHLGVAVSGGPDSIALLLLAHAALPGRIAAATVDHGLRAESAAEAELVAAICARLEVPHGVLNVSVQPGNIQTEARTARYAALAGWAERLGLAALMTAHHADDQAETLLLRLIRGSGVAGLAGVRARGLVPGTALPLLRPVLGWRRADLAAVVSAAGIATVQDPSNSDDRFDRARLRKALETADWIDVPALAASAAHLADADAALNWMAVQEWDDCVVRGGLGLTYRPRAPRAVALRVIARIVAELDGTAPRGSAAARVFDALVARQPASIGTLVARAMPDGWTFTKAPQRRS